MFPYKLVAMTLLAGLTQVVAGEVNGRVVNRHTGRPISGALAVVGEDRFASVTDDSGKFRISRIPPGDYLFRVEFRCFKPWILYHLRVDAKEPAQLNISLTDPQILQGDTLQINRGILMDDKKYLGKSLRMLYFVPDSSKKYR